MRIVFLCGSLEPGRDGVGDYTRCLAAELVRLGYSATIVSLFDKDGITTTNSIQYAGDVGVPVLRIPRSISARTRFSAAEEFIKASHPDWLSLQFVPFSFDEKGLPIGFARRLRGIDGNIPWHIMFHELWAGMEVGAPKKLVLLGGLQRRIIRSLLRTLNPDLVHTHAGLYIEQLRNLGFSPKGLPLFSSIPVLSSPDKVSLAKKAKSIVAFGSVHPGAPIEDFMEDLCFYREAEGLNVEITFIGAGGFEVERWMNACRAWNVPAVCLGELSTDDVSKVLSKADYGLSTTPALMSEKSSAIAAMQAHGLPVICLRQLMASGFENDFVPSNVSVYKKGCLSQFLDKGKSPSDSGDGLSAVASSFVKELIEAHQPIAIRKSDLAGHL